MNGQKLEAVTSIKNLGATLCKDGTCSADVGIRVAPAIARLHRIWRCNTISFPSKVQLYKSLVNLHPPLWSALMLTLVVDWAQNTN